MSPASDDSKLRICVVMATYEGARYLEEQLNSLASQSRLPDELLVTDDGSRDATCELVRTFAAAAPFKVRLLEHGDNVGYCRNFERGLEAADADLVALADQDDYWLPGKLAEVEQAFRRSANAQLLLNDAELADDVLRPAGLGLMAQIAGSGGSEQEFVTGCCMTVRRPLLELALPIPRAFEAHDQWLELLARRCGVKEVLASKLQLYRRHGNTTSNWLPTRLEPARRRDRVAETLAEDPTTFLAAREAKLAALAARLRERRDALTAVLSAGCSSEELLGEIAREADAVQRRQSLRQQRGPRRLLAAVAMLLGGGYRYFSGVGSFIRDVLPFRRP